MPKPIVAALSLDTIVHEPGSRAVSQTSDLVCLASFGLVAAVIIGIFFGLGFSLITAQTEMQQASVGSAAGNQGAGIKRSRSDGGQVQDSNTQPVAMEPELPTSDAVSLPAASLVEVPAPDAAPPGDAAPVTAATDGPSGVEAGRAPPLASPAMGSPQEVASSPSAAPPVAELLARGDSFVFAGDIASARVFYERAADAGDRRGALRMGATFDPAFLSRAGLDGASGNPAKARSWYRRVLDFDAEQAGHRQKNLAAK